MSRYLVVSRLVGFHKLSLSFFASNVIAYACVVATHGHATEVA